VDVGIGKKQPVAASLIDSSVQGVYFTEPSLRQSVDVDRANPWILMREAIDKFEKAIGGRG
jgi:hypothetical protein